MNRTGNRDGRFECCSPETPTPGTFLIHLQHRMILGCSSSTLVLPDIPAGEQQVRAGVLALLKNESDVEAAATAQPIDVLNESLPKFVPE